MDFSTAEFRLNVMIIDVSHHRVFNPPQITDIPLESCRQYFKAYVLQQRNRYPQIKQHSSS
jgi:hypothetical protein